MPKATAAAFLFASGLAAQAGWLPLAPGIPDGPSVLTHGMATDPVAGVLVFGGHPSNSNYSPSDQLWRWRDGAWTQLVSAHRPPARRGPMMALDTNRNVVVMYGGFLLNDTWEWDGVDWRQVSTFGIPDARTGAGFCFDSARNRCVLYGGILGWPTYSDTWEFDGANWVQREASWPPQQEYPAMAFDRRRGRSVMVAQALGQSNVFEWAGNGWAYVGTLPVFAPTGGMAVYDEARARIVFHTNGSYLQPTGGDTWEFDGATWVLRDSDPTVRRVSGAMAAERRSGSVWLYGGLDPTAATTATVRTIREYRSEPNARYATFGSGCGAVVPSLQVQDWPWLGDTLRVRITGPAGAAAVLNTGFSTSVYQGTPLPLDLGAAGFPGCTAYVGPEVTQVLAPVAGVATFQWAVPDVAALLGVQFAQQALFVQGAALAVSAGASVQLGRR